MRAVGIQSIQKAHGSLESELDTGPEILRKALGKAASPMEVNALVKSRGRPAEIPSVSGIYQIRCVRTGKIYVGSAVNLRARWDFHRRALAIKQHHNPHLQAAWNLYGAESFEFSVLQYVEETQLLTIEQRWIERTGCVNQNVGFIKDGPIRIASGSASSSRRMMDSSIQMDDPLDPFATSQRSAESTNSRIAI